MANDTYTFAALQAGVTHALAGTPNPSNPATLIVNRALDYLVSLRAWIWRQKPLSLDYLQHPNSSITRVSSLITVNTATAHGLIPGLPIVLFGVTSSTTVPLNGAYTVASTPTGSQFTVLQSGSPPDDNAPSAPGSWLGGYITLPADFASFVTLKSATNSFRDVIPTTMEDLLDRRQFAYGSTYELYYCVSYIPQSTTTSEPTPIIQVFPTPTQAQVGALQGIYCRRIQPMVGGTDLPDIPSTFHHLLYILARAFAISSEEDQSGTDWQMFNTMLATYATEDGAMQGPMQGKMRSTLHPRTYPVSQFYPNGRITA
jgi:hypothetical protein